jgi:hypothetical protein
MTIPFPYLDILRKKFQPTIVEPPSIITQAELWGHCRIIDFRAGKPDGHEYFNCSLGRINDRDWLFVRRSRFDAEIRLGQNDIMAFGLDNNFLPQVGYKCELEKHHPNEHQEDARYFSHKGQHYLSACTFLWDSAPNPPMWSGAHQAVWRISENFKSQKRFDPVFGNNSSTNSCRKGNEKNWIFYSYKDRLFLLYESTPLTIVEFDSDFKPLTSTSQTGLSGSTAISGAALTQSCTMD